MIGAGAAGLAAGRTLIDRGLDVHVLDAGSRPGGVMDTVQKDGFLFERGPNTFRLSGPALAFLRGAGIEAALVKARSDGGKRFLLRHGELEAVPMGPLAFATSPMLSARAKFRLLAEPFTGRGDGRGETVAAFIERRMGPEVLERLVGPFLVGVYAGDEHLLGAEAVFPALVGYEQAAGSILAGALRDRFRGEGPKGAPGSWSASGGMAGLVQALARPLGARLHLDSPVRSLARDGDLWRVETERDSYRTARVILATPAQAAAELLRGVSADAAAIAAGIEYAPMVEVPLSVDPTAATRPIEGFGFLVPKEEGLDLLGGLFMNRLFPGRAPGGRELVVGMIGGRRWPGAFDAHQEDLHGRVAQGLQRALGLRGGFEPLDTIRWRAAVPQPTVGHPGRIAAARAALAGGPPLELAGAWVDGVSVADALASGHAAALRVLAVEATPR